MQCDETISHMVTAGWSYFRTLRNACVTGGKTTMTAGKIYHGYFEMLSRPHRSEVRVYRTPAHEHTVGRRLALGLVSRQPALDV